MSTWRGGFKPAFPSQATNGNPSTRPTNSAFSGFNPSASSPFAIGDRGRGRGRGRGAVRGLPNKRGGANLSWKRTESTDQSQQDGDDGIAGGEAEDEATPPSAFEAFGASGTPGGGGGTTSSAFGEFPSNSDPSTSAFGSGGSAFGSNGAFRSSEGAFPSSIPAFGGATSAFPGSSSAFAPTPTPFSAPPPPIQSPASDSLLDDEALVAASELKRNPAQISTLEVLGEDSDARRKRFESTLPNNRYLELKPMREEQRLKAIKQGLIPDPSKPMRLDQATDFEGTCDEMCPEWEREEREYQNNVDPLERYPGTSRIDPSRAVKAFHRPAAGNDQPLPSDVRPPPILYKTLDYLFHSLLPQHALATTHPFVRDRTRSVRQDFTVQNVRGHSAIECNERIARYHILALGTLREQSGFSESQELEQLRKVLKSLNEFYDDLRLSNPNVSLPNEAEFRSFHLLTHLRDPDIIWSTELLPPHVFSHPLLQTALQLHRLAQKSNTARGERASPNAFSRFFKLVESPKVPYLFGCILSTHFNEIRKNALEALRGAYLKQHSAFPLRTLTKVLGCDDEAETRSVCEQLGVVVRTDERGRLVAELHKGTVLKSTTLKLRVSKRLVEAKRGSTSYQAVIDGANYSSRAVPRVPTTPGLASASSTFAPSRSQLSSVSQPSFSSAPATTSFQPFSSAASNSGPSTAFPTPVSTPPPFASSVATTATAKPSLDASALPFVPSFGTSSAAAPPPSFSFASSSAPPTSQASASQPIPSTFSFAPTATPFVPSSAAAPPPPNFFAPSPSVPPTNLTPTPFDPASIAPNVSRTPETSTPSSVPSLRRLSSPSTLARTCPKPSHVSPPPKAPHAAILPSEHLVVVPHLTPRQVEPVKVDRKPLIDSVSQSLTLELLNEAIQGPVRRIGQEVVKERWNVVHIREEREKERVGQELSRRVISEIGQLLIREVGVVVKREEKLRREVVGLWADKTKERQKRRREGLERKREWEEVIRGLGTQGRRAQARDEEDEPSDDELFMEEEEEVGLAGDGDVDFELGGLSLTVENSNRFLGAKEVEPEEDMAEKLKSAAEARRRIWANSTFLDILASQVTPSFAHRRLPSRPAWTSLVATPSIDSSFATWLSCKFGLDGEDMRATRTTADAHVAVQMLTDVEEVDQDDLDSTGLIVFDCTALPGDAFDWEYARESLKSLVGDVERDSLYKPALLVLVCPNNSLEAQEQTALRQTISEQLDLAAHAESLAGSEIMLVKLDGAETSFGSNVSKLLASVSIRQERIRRPLAAYSKPLLAAWRTRVRTNLDRCKRDDLASTIVSTFIDELQEVITEIESVVHPSPTNSVSLPSFPDVKTSFRSAVEAYASSPEFSDFGNFPEIAAAFAQRPPISDQNLARLLLDLLDQFVTTSYRTTLTVLQVSLDQDLRRVLERIEDGLSEAGQAIRQAAREAEVKAKQPPPLTTTKKRKASVTPSDSISRSPKKSTVHLATTDTDHDRLSALEQLMKETKALLST